ncbi:emp24/gp25L/p24 family/GOLD-domain-containing protein [Fimicolochytrium jonesii]|uniref:emp24/gp25L/p24 family/GOLD-domain-containing protein n=1 Tax=Fimicolochytrium jonesii TaxID=1396493 RepID=UPI0022FE0886|nr:emp24/gp25L/p24 family/GOLD-domain-containing protein [Fimicolochytrium jonesii]KAI8826747.1 emp24/gp25L/p24 family/GOLD-domain-containing protein [Fimicolochytrium jonesii]
MRSSSSLFSLALCLALCSSYVQALYFYLEGSKERCFYEELPAETTVVGNYKSEEANPTNGQFVVNPERGIQINVEQTDRRHNVINVRGDHAGKFVFSSADAGEYSICLHAVSSGWFSSASRTRLHIDLMFGEATHEDQPELKKESLSDLALRLRDLNQKVANVRREQQYQKEREAEFRNTSEAANSHVRTWTIAQVVVMGITCAWQIQHLRRFFVAKKLV